MSDSDITNLKAKIINLEEKVQALTEKISERDKQFDTMQRDIAELTKRVRRVSEGSQIASTLNNPEKKRESKESVK